MNLTFGKYKNKRLEEIIDSDPDYCKYLCNLVHFYDEEKKQIISNNRSDEDINEIIENSNVYIEECLSSDITKHLTIGKREWWISLRRASTDMSAKMIYNEKNAFNLLQLTLGYKPINFSNLYLAIEHPDVIQKTRHLVKEKKLCLYCYTYMTSILDDWTTRRFHKECFKNIITDSI